MDIFRKPRYYSLPAKAERGSVPENLWVKCPKCNELNYVREFQKNFKVCAKCSYHFRLTAGERVELLLDAGSFIERHKGLIPADPLGFADDEKPYPEKIREVQQRSGLLEAVVCGTGKIEDIPVVVAVLDFNFLGASMGSVVGEKITRSIEDAVDRRVPLIIVAASGGARMHEGLFSLLQMAKTAAALSKLAEQRLPYISIFTDPTTGGVTASFASLGDVSMAEPGALIGFAGPRVIEQTTRQKLPPGFQTAEFLLERGMIDMVVPRRELKRTIAKVLCLYTGRPPVMRAEGDS
ncbi:MAG: acetyl-CoA carboxylase, carboxyltransferase subunit beta [Dehalococcoidia bacterium]|nr:acetyl-CoA carboxylase, carboxyltransferase subunit beta [Dehalococcoidia bacterium]